MVPLAQFLAPAFCTRAMLYLLLPAAPSSTTPRRMTTPAVFAKAEYVSYMDFGTPCAAALHSRC